VRYTIEGPTTRASSSIAHRGSRSARGARRLSVIDVAGGHTGHQPLSNEQTDVWAVLERPGAFSFASELSALCQGGDVDGDLSAAAVDAFFVFGYVPGPDAILRGVRQLPPGHVLTWEPGAERAALRAYWSPPSCEPCPAEPRSELVAETRRLLEGSVRSRMIADVPLGVFLSGGGDSTVITALAARHSTAPRVGALGSLTASVSLPTSTPCSPATGT